MKFKLDENLDPRAREILTKWGHEVMTVQEEGLRGASDTYLIQVARQEDRCFVTLDLDFADILAFPPHQHRGIIVLRHPKPTVRGLLGLVEQLGQILRTEDPNGKLWIVEPGRLRIHEPSES
jgi:predicted nuclease of predicted toxin-antitoxin system